MDKHGVHTVTRGYLTNGVVATIYHLFGLKLEQRIKDGQGQPHLLLDDDELIAEILSS